MIPKDSGRKENWYIRFITLCMSNFNIPESQVHVGAAISFPLGQTTLSVKLAETKQAILDGADEIDYVINIAVSYTHLTLPTILIV